MSRQGWAFSTVDLATLIPSFRSSATIRGGPQVRLASHIPRMSFLSSRALWGSWVDLANKEKYIENEAAYWMMGEGAEDIGPRSFIGVLAVVIAWLAGLDFGCCSSHSIWPSVHSGRDILRMPTDENYLVSLNFSGA